LKKYLKKLKFYEFSEKHKKTLCTNLNTEKTLMRSKSKVQKQSIKKIYYVIAFCNILVNLDHGIIPAATKEIKTDLQIAEVELGLLGSIVYGGLLLGSLVAGQIFQKFNSKSIITTTISAYILSLLMFPISKDILLLGLSRFLVGFFQVK